MKIEFCIKNIDSFLPEIANQLGLTIENNAFHIPEEQGKGYFSQLQFNKDILITYYQLLLNEPTTVVRNKSDNENIVPIICWLTNSGIVQEIESEQKELGKNSPNGIFLPANSTETKYTFPSGVLVKNMTLFVTKSWLLENIDKQNNYLSNVILASSRYFLFEEMNYEMNECLMHMEDTLLNHREHPLSKIQLYGDTLKLLHLFLEKIVDRPVQTQMLSISPRDIQGLFKVKKILTDEFASIPSTDHLAKECGINQRKLQRLFKQVFGKSIYQFAVSIKMKEARKMLLTKNYNVSEVGYLVGYSNLSHFSEMYREFFGISPKSFLKAN